MKFSEIMTKYIEILVLKLKANTTNIQSYMGIFNKHFLTIHASMIAKVLFQGFILCSIWKLKKNKLNKYFEN